MPIWRVGLIGVLLSLVGVFVVARDQIFIGAAVSQASLFGIAVGMWSGHLFAVGAASWWKFRPVSHRHGRVVRRAGGVYDRPR